jgi:hypothetical protein
MDLIKEQYGDIDPDYELPVLPTNVLPFSSLPQTPPEALARLDEDQGITRYERHVVVEDQLNNNQVQSIDRLPAAVADALNAAMDQHEHRASLATDPFWRSIPNIPCCGTRR